LSNLESGACFFAMRRRNEGAFQNDLESEPLD